MAGASLVNPWSVGLTLDETVARLGNSRRVRAVGYLGSTGTTAFTEASDYDLLLLVDDYSAGCGIETTIIDHRIADLVIVGVAEAEGLAARSRGDAATSITDREWSFINWLAHSRPVYDPAGLARKVRGCMAELSERRPPMSDTLQQRTRSYITHDLRVSQALLRRSNDPVMRVALGMRQLHTFVAVVQAWFTARGLRYEGWKKNISRLADADAQFLGIIERWLAAIDVQTRHEIFAEAVRDALAPLGGPLPEEIVMSDAEGVWEYLTLRQPE